MAVKNIHGSTTTLNGCTVEIDGDVVYALFPPRVSGFRGVVHIAGGQGCPSGDLFFGNEEDAGSAASPPPGNHKRQQQ